MGSTINFVCFSLFFFFGDLRQRCQFYFQFVIVLVSLVNHFGDVAFCSTRRCGGFLKCWPCSFLDPFSFFWKCLTWTLSERIALSTRVCAQPSTISCAAFVLNFAQS